MTVIAIPETRDRIAVLVSGMDATRSGRRSMTSDDMGDNMTPATIADESATACRNSLLWTIAHAVWAIWSGSCFTARLFDAACLLDRRGGGSGGGAVDSDEMLPESLRSYSSSSGALSLTL